MEKQNRMEKQTKCRRMFKILIPLTLILIWGNSIMPGNVSGDISGGLMNFIKKFFGIAATDPNSTLHFIIRKIGHFSEFCLLGIEISLYNYKTIKDNIELIILSGVSVALIDETIQLFVEGRAGQVADVWIDLTGYLVGVIVIAIVKNVKSKTVK